MTNSNTLAVSLGCATAELACNLYKILAVDLL